MLKRLVSIPDSNIKNSSPFKLPYGQRKRILVSLSADTAKRLTKTISKGFISGFVENAILLLLLMLDNDIGTDENKELLINLVDRIMASSESPYRTRWNLKVLIDEINERIVESYD